MSASQLTVLLLVGCTLNRREAIAGAAITPGHLIKRNSSNQFVVHSSATKFAQSMFALEDELQGKGITNAYAQNDRVQANVCLPGDQVNALLKASENVAIGDFLESAGDGTLQKMVLSSADDPQFPVAIALEASNVGTVARIAVEIV